MSTQPRVSPRASAMVQPPMTLPSQIPSQPPVSSQPLDSAAPVSLLPTHISVTFKIVTPDQMRRIIFALSKVSEDQTESWAVMFELDERADTNSDFQMVIQLQVDLDETANAQSAATAKHGLDTNQRAQALTAGDTAKDAKTGDATLDDAKEDATGIITSRDASSPV